MTFNSCNFRNINTNQHKEIVHNNSKKQEATLIKYDEQKNEAEIIIPTVEPTPISTPTPTIEPVIETPIIEKPVVIETPIIEDNWTNIYAYYYLTKPAYLFNDESFNNPSTLIDAYQKIYVIKYNGEWSYCVTDNGEYGYMEPYLLERLPEEIFVEVDLSTQTTKLYNNQEEIYSTPNVTGKDNTPTDEGYFDIDAKTMDTYLTSYYPNGALEYSTHVDYWMPYNGGEGLHDAPWQNGHFGDPDYYHYGGSHGCVNLPFESASIIYDNVNIGTRVLVHK